MKHTHLAAVVVVSLTSPSFAESNLNIPQSPAGQTCDKPTEPTLTTQPQYLQPIQRLLESARQVFENVTENIRPHTELSAKPSEEQLFGLTTSIWLVIVTAVYAFATAAIAFVTNSASKRALKAAADATAMQVRASAEGIERQIAASADNVKQQASASREAAVIQARATSISNNRQQWINSLRNEVTGFLTDADMLPVIRDEMPLSEERDRQFMCIARALRAHIFKVRLLINPTEGESCELVEMLNDAMQSGLRDELREQIVSHTQRILKTEWERVKSGA